MFFNEKKLVSTKKKRKRIGRGISAGQGKSCGRGQKGQNSRSGGKVRIGFEGGQTNIYRRIPKKGQNQKPKLNNKKKMVINLGLIQKNFSSETLDFSDKKIKVLGDGSFDRKINITADSFSASAKKKIEKFGGS